MPRSPLETVRWLRQRAVDDSRRSLAASLAAAAEADAAARAAELSIEREAERASDLSGDDNLVEAFAAWLPGARRLAVQARALQDRHETEAACRRAELAASRAALEAIEALLEQRRVAKAARDACHMQHGLDEMAARTAAAPA